MAKVYHLGLDHAAVKGAKFALLPGDPARVARIGAKLTGGQAIGGHREYESYIGYSGDEPVVVCSTGIGGPSLSICVEELAQLGIRNFIRIGTCGAIQDRIQLGDVVISHASVRLDGASYHYAPPEFPAVADFELTEALVQATRQQNLRFHVGVTATSDTFYPGQERYDTYTKRIIPRFRGSLAEWKALGVLNFEMESATLFTMCQAMGLRSACIAGVIARRAESERAEANVLTHTEERSIAAAIAAVGVFQRLVGSGSASR